MASHILLFGDSSDDFRPFAARLASFRHEGTLINRFLRGGLESLQSELQRASRTEEEDVANIHSLDDVIRLGETQTLHPAIQAALVVLVQLGSFVKSYEDKSDEAFPDCSSPCVGFCLGEISAAVVASASNLLHVLELAPLAIRVAFRVGLLAARVRNGIESKHLRDQPWSVAIDRSCGINDTVLTNFYNEQSVGPSKRIWLSFRDRRTDSFSGPPSTLTAFTTWLKEKNYLGTRTYNRMVPISAPYHTSTLFSKSVISRELEGLPDIHTSSCLRPLISSCGIASTIQRHPLPCHESLFFTVAENILIRTMDWQAVCKLSHDTISKHTPRPESIRPFGPTTVAKHFKSTIQDMSSHTIALDQSFGDIRQKPAMPSHTPLAIVGMALRLPGATNVDELWSSLCAGIDFAKEIPKDRFDPKTHLKSKAFGCFIDDVDQFDAKFFNMSPREASQTDPGHRLAMMTALEAMENAGLVVNRTPSTKTERIGTFFGQTVDEYKEQNMALNVDTYYIPGSLRAFAPGRLNYFFKFGGPAYAIDTACSSGAVAINLACKSIWSGECDTALAGGINTLCGSNNYNGLAAGHFLSPTGNCKTFDGNADGYCRAEGICSLVIKRLDAALADNDHIHGLIRATATNFASEAVSITRPHGPTQESLYRSTLCEAGIKPADVDYVELHGTGTQAGDQVETKSVVDVFAPTDSSIPRTLFLSAVKPNVGHSEAASGPTSLIKALKVLQTQRLPPHVGIKSTRNSLLPDFEARNVSVPRVMTQLPLTEGSPKRALVSNFSAAGGCTAFVLEESRPTIKRRNDTTRSKHPVCISAKNKISLLAYIKKLERWLESNPLAHIEDLSYTSTARRQSYPWRRTLIATSCSDLLKQLSSVNEDNVVQVRQAPKLVFTFTGQGSWHEGVAQDLFKSCTVFRECILRFDETCKRLGLPSFLDLMMRTEPLTGQPSTAETQLCIVAIEMALYRLWTSWNVSSPVAVLGHSLGEYVALYAAGVLSEIDTLWLVGQRALLLEAKCKPGTHAMLAVQAAVEDLKSILQDSGDQLEVACINGPTSTVLSGAKDCITQTAAKLADQGVKCKELNLPYGFHSTHVEPILDDYEKLCEQVTFNAPLTPIASTLLGRIVDGQGVFGPTYLRKQCRHSVNFSGAIESLRDDGVVDSETLWMEIGPQPLCMRMVQSTLGSGRNQLYSLKKDESSWASLAAAVATAHDLGVKVNWQQYHADFESGLSVLSLPTYAFDLQRHWIDYNDFLLNIKDQQPRSASGQTKTSEAPAMYTTSVHRIVSLECEDDEMVKLSAETDLLEDDIRAAVLGHLVCDVGLCPASIYGDIALTIGSLVRERYPFANEAEGMNITKMNITKPITVDKARSQACVILKVGAKARLGGKMIDITFALNDDESPRATCTLVFGDVVEWREQWARGRHFVDRCVQSLSSGLETGTTHKLFRGMIYKLFADVVDYDRKYQGMHELMMNSEELEATALLQLYNGTEGGRYLCSPFWIDAIVHIAGFVMNANEMTNTSQWVYISGGWDAMRFSEKIDPKKTYRVYVKMIPIGKGLVAGDVVLLHNGETVGTIDNLRFQQVPRQVLAKILAPNSIAERRPSHDMQPIKRATPKRTGFASPNHHLPQDPSWSERQNSHMRRRSSIGFEPILAIIAEEIGVSTAELTPTTNLAELGADSLLCMTITSQIEQRLGLLVPVDSLLACATISELGDMLQTLPAFSTAEIASDNASNSSNADESNECSTLATPVSQRSSSPAKQAPAQLINSARSIVAAQVGISEEDLPLDGDLTEFGVDSLMWWSIGAALEQQLGVTVSPDIIGGSPSVLELEKALQSLVMSQKPNDLPAVSHGNEAWPSDSLPSPPKLPSLRTKGLTDTSRSARGDPMLLHRNGGSRCLWIFPDGGGSAAAYLQLSAIHDDFEVWGLNLPGASDVTMCSIESMAEHWLAQIKARQPSGPYFLAGWSAGGFSAVEAARQLLAQGERVESLVLIDSPCPLKNEAMPLEVLETLLQQGIIGGRNTQNDKKLMERITSSFHCTISAVRAYRPRPIVDGPFCAQLNTVLIWASDGLGKKLPQSESDKLLQDKQSADITRFLLMDRIDIEYGGWNELIPGALSARIVQSAHHFDIVQQPAGRNVAAVMKQALDGALKT